MLHLSFLLFGVWKEILENLKYLRKARVHTPRRRFKGVPSAKLRSSINPVITSWLAGELEKEIPDLDIHGSERRLLEFACKDLETYLNVKQGGRTFDDFKKP